MKKKFLLILAIGILSLALCLVGCQTTGEARGSKPQCNDGLDNDGDKKCDYISAKTRCPSGTTKGDPDCTSTTDNKEAADCIPATEICDNKDNDCDGSIDEGLTQQCGTSNVGECKLGSQTCTGGSWGLCVGAINPSAEICDNKDNDCDGGIDDNLGTSSCGIGSCYRTVDNCINGIPQTCVPGTPQTENCNNVDDDCDGSVDESLSQQCGITNIGECDYGLQTCSSGTWGQCNGMINPTNETCDGKDNDCDGVTDEGCDCVDGQGRSCGINIGACEYGNQTCSNGIWGACIGEISPSTEACNGIDDDCDGSSDENLGSSTCGVGACQRTVQNCVNGTNGTCSPGTPATEICNSIDDDCDGSTDENNVCDLSSCSDSDGGWVISIQGTVTGINSSGGPYSGTDYCINNATVFEFACIGKHDAFASYPCSNSTQGYCYNGACS